MAFTNEQQAAIKARGKVLVSASAGAGKTTVMIKRLADILEDGASLDNVLAVTFTKKAAAQMKEKLRSELVSRLSEADERKRENIRTQLGKINSADISTIHSFCARLVRTYFYAFDGVDASFEIAADGTDVSEMQNRAMDNLFDRLYGKGEIKADENFLYLVDRLKKKRSDQAVREAILQAYSRLRIEPGYESIADKTERTFCAKGFEAVCEKYGLLLGERCLFYANKVNEFGATLAFASGGEGYAKVLSEMYDSLNYVAVKRSIFDRPEKLNKTSKPRVKPENAEEDARFADFCKGIKKRYDNLFKDIKTREEERVAFEESGKLARAFADVLLQFDREYTAVKREEGKLDYGDLEHLAYSLICSDDSADRDIKEQINEKYAYVFVDEYQDVNPIQDAIINTVACGDVFKVGDVKQAIYGFRGSRSHFFAAQLEQAATEGASIILPHNFRSSDAVVNLVNELFSKVMTKSACGFDYANENHAMISGLTDNDGRGAVEICTFDNSAEEREGTDGVYSITEEKPESAPPCAESTAIVNLVEELLKKDIYDAEKRCVRRIQQGDICVLTRKKSKKSIAEAERLLLAEGYNVDGATEANVCDRAEIKQLLNILFYLDNAEQDVALAASLLSPLGGFCEDELAAIRVFGGVGREAPPFRRCAEKYASEKNDGVSEKLHSFYEKAAKLKRLSEGIGAARLIDAITKEGGFVAVYADANRLSALRRLQKEAYSPAGELSLNAFLAKLKTGGYKVNAPLPLSSDSIKIMTMHASKGLEFPVVILADIAAGFGGDERGEMPYDEEFGFAPRYYESERRVYGGTLLRKLCKLRAETEDLKNEINLFYVACTRAKNNLYILTSKTKPFDSSGVLTADCYADLFDEKTLKTAVNRPIYAGERGFDAQNERGTKVLGSFAADEQLYENLSETFGVNLYGAGASLPVKSSATKILSLAGEEEIHPVMFDEEQAAGGATSVESGIAYHRFLQLCDFTVKDEAGIKSQIESWLKDRLLTEEQAELLEVEQLKNILSMEQFNLLAGAETYREREFLYALSAGEYQTLSRCETPDENGQIGDKHTIIIQGAIDLLVIRRENGKAVAADIIDYKYSSRPDGYLKNKYAPQLALYKKAVAKIYRLNPKDITATIVNIRGCSAVSLDI